MIRGIERRKIFRNNKDREDFLARLGNLLPETQTDCCGWAFLSNHAHFLLRTGKVTLSKLMRRHLTGYVIGFNKRHHRNGQLFHNRFKSIVCQEDVYLIELVRYIHFYGRWQDRISEKLSFNDISFPGFGCYRYE